MSSLTGCAARPRCWRATGIGKGDRIAILSPNRVEIFSIYLGAALVEAATIPINADYAASDIRYILRHSEPAPLVATAELTALAAEGAAGVPNPPRLLEMDALMAEAADAPPIDIAPAGQDEDLVLLCYTSGTTAAPKGVSATHANEIASASAYCGMWAMRTEDRVLVALPLTFSFGFHAATYVALLAGATTLLVPRFHPRHVFDAVPALRATRRVMPCRALSTSSTAPDLPEHEEHEQMLSRSSGPFGPGDPHVPGIAWLVSRSMRHDFLIDRRLAGELTIPLIGGDEVCHRRTRA